MLHPSAVTGVGTRAFGLGRRARRSRGGMKNLAGAEVPASGRIEVADSGGSSVHGGGPATSPASVLEASDELVEGVQVVDVEPPLYLKPVSETHDRTDVEEPLLGVDRSAEALDSQHMVVRA